MKKILASLLLLFSFRADALNGIINCATTPISTVYTTPTISSNSVPFQPSLAVTNNTNGRICVNTVAPGPTPPVAGDGNEHCMAPLVVMLYDKINFVGKSINIYVRADVAPCTTGIVDVDLW